MDRLCQERVRGYCTQVLKHCSLLFTLTSLAFKNSGCKRNHRMKLPIEGHFLPQFSCSSSLLGTPNHWWETRGFALRNRLIVLEGFCTRRTISLLSGVILGGNRLLFQEPVSHPWILVSFIHRPTPVNVETPHSDADIGEVGSFRRRLVSQIAHWPNYQFGCLRYCGWL